MKANQCVVRYGDDGTREISCWCGAKVARSIVPHTRKEHPKLWLKWGKRFAELRNEGWSFRRIMREFADANGRLLFSWTVVEREIKKLREGGVALTIVPPKRSIRRWEPRDFELETRSVWRFEKRGTWAVHSNDYRGNWSPQVPRNLILTLTKPGDLVVDCFAGGGTTLIEAWLTGRRSWGIDVNPVAVDIARQRLDELRERADDTLDRHLDPILRPRISQGDARSLSQLGKEFGMGAATLVCVHPPYLDSLRYTETVPEDLSHIHDPAVFQGEMGRVAAETLKILKPEGHAALLVGDVRRRGNIYPLGAKTLTTFLEAGFGLQDIVIKEQFRDESTEFYYSKDLVRYLLAHEYLFILGSSE